MNIIKGDLIALAEKGKFDFIVHGCNCFNTMKSGIAGQLTRRYPQVAEADSETIRGDRGKLGTYTIATVLSETSFFTVVNAYTQYRYDATKDVFEYEHFDRLLDRLTNDLSVYLRNRDRKYTIGFPQIGAGKANGDWQKILPMICKFSEGLGEIAEVTVVEYSR